LTFNTAPFYPHIALAMKLKESIVLKYQAETTALNIHYQIAP